MTRNRIFAALAIAAIGGILMLKSHKPQVEAAALSPPPGSQPALTVATTTLQPAKWMQSLSANGSVVAWQEAVIGAEVTGVRIAEVRVNVGDAVSKGQVLCSLATETVQAGEAEAQAALKESEAMLAESKANIERVQKLRDAGFASAQQVDAAQAGYQAAQARVETQRARYQTSALRLAQTQIKAPDAGVISARTAAVGTLTQPGAELFRMIRQGRLEWHADLTADELGLVRKGMKVELISPQGQVVRGVVRAIAPAINPQTRYGQVLVDLPANSGLVAGMFARGTFQLGKQNMTVKVLPQSAVVLRGGMAFVLLVGKDGRVHEQKVTAGRRYGEQIEIVSGLEQNAAVVESGGAFLVEGDAVRVAGRPLPNPPPQAGEGANGSLREASVK
jgi:RND family efflux transporter MFP subunit